MDFELSQIATDIDGYSTLASLDTTLNSFTRTRFNIDCSNLSWVDGNMCAALGAVATKHISRNIDIVLHNKSQRISTALRKNNFLPELFHTPPTTDLHSTTIRYHKFAPSESSAFHDYTKEFFIAGAKGLPQMTDLLLKRFRESLWEIFENAVAHSETKNGIYVCGQYFPQKNWLRFCVADLGIGFQQRIYKSTNKTYSPEGAIDWAMADENTTRSKRDGKPGGIGLKLIREFITKNKGSLMIVSDKGFWKLTGDYVNKSGLKLPFPGTAVNIDINTADKKRYCLNEETDINPNDIF